MRDKFREKYIHAFDVGGVYVLAGRDRVIHTGTTLTIPETYKGLPVTRIGEGAFNNNGESMKLTNVTIPNSVTSIEDYAFAHNNLTEVTIPDSVISIGENAFVYNSLTEVTIGNSVTSIGYSAFARNYLTEVTIPDSVTSIGNAFFDNTNLTKITIGANVDIGSSAGGISNWGSFASFYMKEDGGNKQAGTYIYMYSNGYVTWPKQP